MFKRFREKIERALERREAERPLSRDEVDRLLHGMREELIEMKSRIPRLERQAMDLDKRAAQQVHRAELAYNKARESQGSGDMDEAQTATEAARDALSHTEDLRRQADESRGEAERLKGEYAAKMDQLKEAERNRDVLVARSRRATTARKLDDMLRGPDSGLGRFERAEDDIEAAEDLAAAEREVSEALGERPPAKQIETDYELRQLEAAKEADEIEERLKELKRQMEAEE
jgi:phage shock protein A